MLRKSLIVVALLVAPMAMLQPLWGDPVSAGEDDLVYYFPLRTMVARQLRSGRLPLWNDREAGGMPLLADPQSGVFFPPNLMFLVLPGGLAYSLSVFLAFSVAGGGAYLYLRRIGLLGPAAAFGAAAFMFSGFMVGHRAHLSMVQAAGLLPWGLWAIERPGGRRFISWVCRMAPILALAAAAGHWPTAAHLVVIWSAYLLVRARPVGRAIAAAALSGLLAAAMLAPQLVATAGWMGRTARSAVPFSVAAENSFNPLCGVLGLFPFIMGSRTPNFFAQTWWGPWHLCEMLGYVGLATLALAASAIWRLRKPAGDPATAGRDPARSFARLWTWVLVAAGLWALGRHGPVFWLIHRLPVFGTVRCPARMLLAVDLALAVLAALAIHSLMTHPPAGLARAARRAATVWVPAGMVACLAVLAVLWAGQDRLWDLGPVLSGDDPAEAMGGSLWPPSPATCVPLALAAVTAAAVWWVLRAPPRRAWLLTAVVLADLFFLTRFVDVTGGGRVRPDPFASPAAERLRQIARGAPPYRVWGLSGDYHRRPTELLLPKACATLGFQTISQYGPLAPAEHVALWGFRPWGENREWAWLIRRNHLLSLFNVRFVLAAEEEFRGVIESVRIPDGPVPKDGPNLLAGAARPGEVLAMKASWPWAPAEVHQPVRLTPGRVYRISLDARAPEGAGGLLIAQYAADPDRTEWWSDGPARLRIDWERLAGGWRHFEWTFQAPPAAGGESVFRLVCDSPTPIEVREVALRESGWESPVNLGGRLRPGERVYVDRTPEGLPPLRPGDPPVHVYENRLCLPRVFPIRRLVELGGDEEVIEALRWRAEEFDLTSEALVAAGRPAAGTKFISEDLHDRNRTVFIRANGMGAVERDMWATTALHFPGRPLVRTLLPEVRLSQWVSLAAVGAYLVLLVLAAAVNRRSRGSV